MTTYETSRWYSPRLQCESTLSRWGHAGQPVLVFPTAGGDAEELERFLMIRALAPLLEAGRIKIFSCDSVGGKAWFEKDKSPEHRMWMQHQYHQYIKQEVAPAIRKDCRTDDIPIWTAGASIGAFHASAVVCRFPDIFSKALAMSGTFGIMKWMERETPTDYFFVSSPLHFVPTLAGRHLDLLRTRYVHFASGEGKFEDISESFWLARVLGEKGIPNYVESWGPDWHHDWVTWRAMMPKILGQWTE